MTKGYKIMTICLFITIAFLLIMNLFLMKEIRKTQLETSEKITFINDYCLE